MRVTIKPSSALRAKLGDAFELTLPEGASVADALAALPLLDRGEILAVVDGCLAPADMPLCEGMALLLYPQIIGG